MKKILVLCVLTISTSISYAQNQDKKNAGSANNTPIEGTFLGFKIPESDDLDLLPELIHLTSENESFNQKELEKLKEEKMKLKMEYLKLNAGKTEPMQKTRGSIDPIVAVGYNAVGTSGTPSDNTVAVNKAGQLIAIVNSTMRIYNTSSGAGIGSAVNTDNFFSSLGSNLNTCDPKVIYDQQADRFIVFAQTCDGSSTTSKLLLAFAKNADPTQGWYFYSFTGNLSGILGSNTWFDYPKIGVSNHDVFVSGNLFDDNYSYVESVVYQIDKTKGYAGTAIGSGDASVWTGISNNPFTLVPISNGQTGGYGNNIYLMANQVGWTGGNLLVFEVTNSVQASPTMTVQSLPISTNDAPAGAVQKGTSITLNTGDSRGMDGFYLNGTIHFVFHCDVGSGFSGINYSRLTKSGSNWQISKNKLLKIAGKDCSFPSIASMGYSANDQSAIIHFDYASSTDYPGMKVVFVDNNFISSNFVEVKTGAGYADVLSSNETRWGDYSAISRVQNASTPTAWCFGMFGNTSHSWTNYFAKITTQAWATGTEDVTSPKSEVAIYPNPIVEDFYKIKLKLVESGKLKIKLLDITGNLIKNVFEVNAFEGENIFTFNKGALESGNYFVNITLDNKTISNEKITIIR